MRSSIHAACSAAVASQRTSNYEIGSRGPARAASSSQPPRASDDRIRVGDVRFDVEYRRAVEHVDVAHVQRQPVDAFEPHGGQAERIRPVRRARREHALAARAAARRQHLRPPAVVTIEPEQHPDVLPTVEVAERVLEVLAGQELDASRDPRRRARLARAPRPSCERRAHVADRLERQRRHDRARTGRATSR